MSALWQKIKTPVLIVVILALAFFLYAHFFTGQSTDTSNLASDNATASSTETTTPEEQQFLALLLKIQHITINQSIFSDPVFLSLQDDGLPILDQPQGRPNPFAPIGSGNSISSVVGSSSASANIPAGTNSNQ